MPCQSKEPFFCLSLPVLGVLGVTVVIRFYMLSVLALISLSWFLYPLKIPAQREDGLHRQGDRGLVRGLQEGLP